MPGRSFRRKGDFSMSSLSAKDDDVTATGVRAAGRYCVDMSVRPGNVCSSSLHFIKSAVGEDV